MKKWEYKVLRLSSDVPELDDHLKEFGDAGWELVTSNEMFNGCRYPGSKNLNSTYVFIFKREIPDIVEQGHPPFNDMRAAVLSETGIHLVDGGPTVDMDEILLVDDLEAPGDDDWEDVGPLNSTGKPPEGNPDPPPVNDDDDRFSNENLDDRDI